MTTSECSPTAMVKDPMKGGLQLPGKPIILFCIKPWHFLNNPIADIPLFHCVFTVSINITTSDKEDVCIFLSTDLINIQNATLVVEPCVQFIQHGDDLHRCALGTHGCKAHDVREQHGNVIKFASWHWLTLPQFLGHVTWKYGVKEIHGSPLFLLQCLVSSL